MAKVNGCITSISNLYPEDGVALFVNARSNMPDKVPLWIIKNTFCPYGSRMPQRPETMSSDLKICATCQKQMFTYREWNWCAGDYYCDTCIIEARKKDREKWAGTYGRTVHRNDNVIGFEYVRGITKIPANEGEIPSGNLPENDYAFWIGNTERYTGGAKSLRATCRACSQEVFGEGNRSAHRLIGPSLYLNQLTCAKVLMLSYQQLLKLDLCMVCNSKCFGKQKWGVPLCCPNCIMHWKFNETAVYENLEKAVLQFWATKTGGSITSESTSSQT